MRPSSLRLFDGLFLAGIFLGLANFVLGASLLSSEMQAVDSIPNGRMTLIGAVAFGTLLALTLWYLISRVRIEWLKWVLAALVLLGLTGLPDLFIDGIQLMDVIGLIASLLQALAVIFLFRADAKAWFAQSGS